MILKEHVWIFKNELSNYFCKDIVKLGNQTKKHLGIYSGKNGKRNSKKVRNSHVCFLNDWWIKRWFDNYFFIANKNAEWNFQFDRYEAFQFTQYKINQHYSWHPDSFVNKDIVRKLSGIILLSDPQDYKGGEIEFRTPGNKIIKMGKQPKGTILIFPSFVYHRVKPVTSGKRYSLVIWACGENFK
ncbi:MAG: hypothetical protein CMF74_13650 [Maricaulis sp.]|nr:hypothetical protein [Maricaulis sp.]